MTTAFGTAPVCAEDQQTPSGDAFLNQGPGAFQQVPYAQANIQSLTNAVNQMARVLNGFIGGIVNKKNTIVHIVQKVRTYQVNTDGSINKNNFIDTHRTLKYKETNPTTKMVLTNIDNTNTFASLDGSNVTVLDTFSLPQ